MQPNASPDVQCIMLVKNPTRRSTRKYHTKSSEIYHLADVVGDKPVKNDAGEMSMSDDPNRKSR